MNRLERRRRTAKVLAKRKNLLRQTGLLLNEKVRRYHQHLTDSEWHRKCAVQLGKCRKKKPLDCGNTGCFVCGGRSREIYGPTMQEVKSDLNFFEQMLEV